VDKQGGLISEAFGRENYQDLVDEYRSKEGYIKNSCWDLCRPMNGLRMGQFTE
jgi:hypothetical protein